MTNDVWIKRPGNTYEYVPGPAMKYREIHELTNFGKLLHKEGLWSLYSYAEEKSLMFHLCRGWDGMSQDNSPVDPASGQCSACGKESPDEIRGIWTLHNFDWIQKNAGGEVPDV